MNRVQARTRAVLFLLSSVFFLTGCGPSRSAAVYTSDQAMRVQTFVAGTVESVKAVIIESGKEPVAGAVIGGVTGGVVGSTIGNGSGSKIAAVAGALAGAVGGAMAEKKLTTRQALEIVVHQDNGINIIVVQEADVPFAPGDRVRVVTSPDGTTRVSK